MLHTLFSFVCGQDPSHTWSPGGVLLPVCQRCAGLYAGAAVTMLLQLTLRFTPGPKFLGAHGLFLLAMVPLGYHWVAQDAVVRAISGVLFGAGLVAFLSLLPSRRLTALDRGGVVIYAVGVLLTLAAVPLLGIGGSILAWVVLSAAAVAGLAVLTYLALANIAALIRR